MNQSQMASAGRPRSAAICSGTLCRCGLTSLTASGTAVLGVDAARTMFGPTPVSGCAAIIRSPSRSIATRSRLVGSFVSNIDTKRCVIWPGASAKKIAATIGSDREQPEVLQREQQRGRGAHADGRAAREGQRDRHGQRRHDERRPGAFAAPEQHARERDADHEHQQPRVGHVVAERALRPLAEVVVVQDAVLDDAEGGARPPRR